MIRKHFEYGLFKIEKSAHLFLLRFYYSFVIMMYNINYDMYIILNGFLIPKRKDRRFQVYDYFAWLELILFIQVKLWEKG